jgi:hypothetical protein
MDHPQHKEVALPDLAETGDARIYQRAYAT